MAVLPLRSKLPRCRRDGGQVWGLAYARDRSGVMPEVRRPLCSTAVASSQLIAYRSPSKPLEEDSPKLVPLPEQDSLQPGQLQ